jgi:hypothetical protein
LITVGELIKMLEQFDPMLPVVTSGFDESDVDYIDKPELVQIVVDAGHGGGHCGEHKLAEESDRDSVPAVWIDF